MMKIYLLLALVGTSAAIELPPLPFNFNLLQFVACNGGGTVNDIVKQCATRLGLLVPNLPANTLEATIADTCRLAQPATDWDAKNIALNTCIRQVCPVSGFVDFLLTQIPCRVILEQILPGCTLEVLQSSFTTCATQNGLNTQIGLAAVIASFTSPDLTNIFCNIYNTYGVFVYNSIRLCILRSCPNIPNVDVASVCPSQGIPGIPGIPNFAVAPNVNPVQQVPVFQNQQVPQQAPQNPQQLPQNPQQNTTPKPTRGITTPPTTVPIFFRGKK